MIGTGLDVFGDYGTLGLILISLAYLLFWFYKEKIYYIPNIDGKWNMILDYIETDYNPYKNMKVKYILYITQKDDFLTIKGEKYFEELSTGKKKEYEGSEKVSCSLEGYIKKGYGYQKVDLNIEEDGQLRKVVGSLDLSIISPKNSIRGIFEKQDANSKGKVYLWRD